MRQQPRPRHQLEILIAKFANFPNPRLNLCLVPALDVHDTRASAGAEKHEALVRVGGAFERGHFFARGDVVRAD